MQVEQPESLREVRVVGEDHLRPPHPMEGSPLEDRPAVQAFLEAAGVGDPAEAVLAGPTGDGAGEIAVQASDVLTSRSGRPI